jgi:hypothetical protein
MANVLKNKINESLSTAKANKKDTSNIEKSQRELERAISVKDFNEIEAIRSEMRGQFKGRRRDRQLPSLSEQQLSAAEQLVRASKKVPTSASAAALNCRGLFGQ